MVSIFKFKISKQDAGLLGVSSSLYIDTLNCSIFCEKLKLYGFDENAVKYALLSLFSHL